MSEELDVLILVVQRLDKEKIPYMLTGSIATNFYTVPRMTRDIDIIIQIDLKDTDKIFDNFKDDFYIDKEMIIDAIKRKASFNIIHNEKLVKVDFIVKKETEYRKEEFGRRKQVSIAGINTDIVAAEDLIISKLYWARDSHSETQLNDVKNVMADNQDLDYDYLKKWIKKLELQDIYEEVK